MKIIRPLLVILTALLGLTIFNSLTGLYSFFSRPLLQEFGGSMATGAKALSLSLLISLPFLLVAGMVFDRLGGRLLIVTGSLLTALASFALYKVTSLNLFIVWYCVFVAGSALFGGIVPVVLLANWFVRLRGIFLGLVVALASAAAVLMQSLTGFLLDFVGWRTAFLVLGLLPLVLAPLALFMKRRPEDDGSVPDFGTTGSSSTLAGRWSALAAGRYHPSSDDHGPREGLKLYTTSFGNERGTALSSLAGILLIVIIVLAYAAKGGTTSQLVPAIMDAGARMSAATGSLGALAITVPIGALVLGVLSDFVHSRFCLVASLLIFGIGIITFSLGPLSRVGPVLMGFGQGGLLCLVTVVLADYFGRGALGTLRSLIAILATIAGGAAPILLGYLYTIGSLSSGFFGAGVAVLVGALLALLMRPPEYEALPVEYASVSQGEKVTRREPGEKARHGCLTAYLALILIGNSASVLAYLLLSDVLKRTYPSAPPWLFNTLALLNAINLIFAFALLRWKKWGFWGFCATSLISLPLNLMVGLGWWIILGNISAILIMYGILQIGGDDKGWPQLE